MNNGGDKSIRTTACCARSYFTSLLARFWALNTSLLTGVRAKHDDLAKQKQLRDNENMMGVKRYAPRHVIYDLLSLTFFNFLAQSYAL